MIEIKKNIVDQIIYFIQDLDIEFNLLHTVIKGPPGVGKTEFGKIYANILSSIKIIKSNKIKIVKRTDLIGEYLGQTAQKTQRVIDESNGGILFIDEAYSLGSDSKIDSYSKECIDILNHNLTEKKNKFICIIAGYSNELDKCFFSHNPGLKRRFPFVYEIKSYEYNELMEIFLKMLKDSNWLVDFNKSYLSKFFEKNKFEFKNFCGDIENLITNCKYAHSKRIFLKKKIKKKKLSKEDLNIGFNNFMLNKGSDENNISNYMYI